MPKFKVTQPIDYGTGAKDQKRYEAGATIALEDESEKKKGAEK